MKKFLAILTALFAVQVNAQTLSYHAGELPELQKIEKVLSAGNPADVLLLAVSPEKLAGFSGFKMSSKAGELFIGELKNLPTLGKIAGKGSTLSAEKIVALQPNLIIDVGNLTPNYQDQADRTFAQTGVPYLLLDGSLEKTPALLRELGKLLGNEKQAEEQAKYAEETLQQAVAFAKQNAKTAYLARNADGLQTGQKGSIHTEAMELIGLQNVVEGGQKSLTQVSMEQLLLWNPDLIFTQYDEFYKTLAGNPQWQNLSAVKNRNKFDRSFYFSIIPPVTEKRKNYDNRTSKT
ncbi:iron ABC transporter substrate-binding protein [Rodentibacter genomosp. 2]|uniref:iron ABC transporter substrate-binding protein n=1 Tax=Rodentibacter genomosp. 2 TaxID=1908266 RepID=UPI000984C4E6